MILSDGAYVSSYGSVKDGRGLYSRFIVIALNQLFLKPNWSSIKIPMINKLHNVKKKEIL